MKESIAIKLAQRSVLNDGNLAEREKLEVLRVLMDREKIALIMEQYEEEQANNE